MPVVFRLQSRQQLEPRPHRHPRAAQATTIPEGYELVRIDIQLKPEQDWRYRWLQKQPNVIAPPAKFKIDPYYTKFTWAREFTVVGTQASDEALLKANDTIRKMFAYRHDILKALIADGVKLVVLGRSERSWPTCPKSRPRPTDRRSISWPERSTTIARQSCSSRRKRMWRPIRAQPNVGDNQVIRVLAERHPSGRRHATG